MELSLRCSLGNFHSSDCGLYNRYPQDRVVKLNSCQKDIKPHLRALKLSVGGECGSLNPNIPTLTDIETYCLPFTSVSTRGRFSTNKDLHASSTFREREDIQRTFFFSQSENFGVLLPVGNGMFTIIIYLFFL